MTAAPNRGRYRIALVAMTAALAGCAMRADLIEQDRRLSGQVSDQRKQIQSLQKEVERLRGDLETGAGRRGGGPGGVEERLADLERRLAKIEGGAPSDTTAVEPAPTPAPPPPQPQARETPPPAPPPAPPATDDAWQRDVAREQAAIAASNAPDRGDFGQILDGVARKDCAKAVPQLNGFALAKKDSPLADNALYWAARCYAAKGDQNQAISKFYDVVTKYPKGDKAPAALWEQGNLFIDLGDTPDARLALGKLIKDYPSSEEASRARKRLTELDR